MRKVAIIGRCYSTRSDAPWDDPSWEIWSLAWDPVPVTHRMFETHLNFRMYLGSQEEGDYHVGGLRMAKVPVVMLEKHEDIPTSVRFPMEDVEKIIGKTRNGYAYLESSIAYMMADLIVQFVKAGKPEGWRVGIFGVDLHCDSEYAFQRPNLEYLIGLARGMGIKVYIPPQSALLTHQMGVPYGFYSSTDAGAPQTPLPQGKAA